MRPAALRAVADRVGVGSNTGRDAENPRRQEPDMPTTLLPERAEAQAGPTQLRIATTWDGAPCRPEEVVTLTLREENGLFVTIDAPFHGDPPPAPPPGSMWELWEHEVVELFVVGPNERYTELELGPYGHDLLLRLEGRRNAVEKLIPVKAAVSRSGDRWTATAHLPAHLLPPRPWRFNAFAVHGEAPNRRFLAWAPVPGSAPDFHALEHFKSVPGFGD